MTGLYRFGNRAGPGRIGSNFPSMSVLRALLGSGEENLLPWAPSLGDPKYGWDKTGETPARTAFGLFAEDCNTLGTVGIIPQGIINCADWGEPVWWGPGTGFVGMWSGSIGGRLEGYGSYGAVFSIPYDDDFQVPKMSCHSSTYFANMGHLYADQIARCNTPGGFVLDFGSGDGNGTYPLFDGDGPDRYAPFYISDHVHDDYGNAAAGGTNCGGVKFFNMHWFGAWDCIFLGDADPELEPWAEGLNSGFGKGISGFEVEGMFGYWFNRGLAVQRSGNISSMADVFCAEGFFTDASQMGTRGTADFQPLVKFALQNARVFEGQRKVVGTKFRNIRARNVDWMFYFDSGEAIPTDWDGPEGQDAGKFGHLEFQNIGSEGARGFCYLSPTAYHSACEYDFRGHYMDRYDHDFTRAAFLVETDSDLAGTIQKRDNSEFQEGEFKPQSLYPGIGNYFRHVRVKECAGPVFENSTADATRWLVTPDVQFGYWGHGDKNNLSCFHHFSSGGSRLYVMGGLWQATENGSKKVFDVEDADVFAETPPMNCLFLGCAEDYVVNEATVAVPDFVFGANCWVDPDDLPPEEPPDPDGDSGNGLPLGDEPEED